MLLRESKVRAAMEDLADRVRNETLEIVAKHLEAKAAPLLDDWYHDQAEVWLAAAREVREIAANAEFNAITERIQP